MPPFLQRNPLQIFPVGDPGVKNGQQEKASPRGLFSPVSEIPAMSPRLFFIGHATALLALAPPSAPRSITLELFSHTEAWPTWSPPKSAIPAAHPRSLILLAATAALQSAGSVTILYVVCAVSQAGNVASTRIQIK